MGIFKKRMKAQDESHDQQDFARANGQEDADELPEYIEEYRIVGKRRHINTKGVTNASQVEDFWRECREDGTLDRLRSLGASEGCFVASCTNFTKNEYDYWIGVRSDSTDADGLESLYVGGGDFFRFDCNGPAHKAVSDTWKYIYNRWFPGSGYAHRGIPEIEIYPAGDMGATDYACEILVPVKPAPAVKQPPSMLSYSIGFLWLLVGLIIGYAVGLYINNELFGWVLGAGLGIILGNYMRKRHEKR